MERNPLVEEGIELMGVHLKKKDRANYIHVTFISLDLP